MSPVDLDLEDVDDLLELEGTKPQPRLQQAFAPAKEIQLERCQMFRADVLAKRVKDVDYQGTCEDLKLWTYTECFDYWYDEYLRKKNPLTLELAFLAAAKCRAGVSWGKVSSPLLPGKVLRAEVTDCLPTLVRLLIDLPFDCTRIPCNVANSKHWRAVWFNRKTRLPVLPSEPFRLL